MRCVCGRYEDVKTKSYMMLPTDMALKTDAEFKKHARTFADSQVAISQGAHTPVPTALCVHWY